MTIQPMISEPSEAYVMVGFLGSELEEALDAMEDMLPYVPEYFRAKWNHDTAIQRARAAVHSYQAFKRQQEALQSPVSDSESQNGLSMPPPPGGRVGHEPSCEAFFGYHCTCQ